MNSRKRRQWSIERCEGRHLFAGLVGECDFADVNDDGSVDAADLAMIAANFGAATTPHTGADADGNFVVNLRDAMRVQARFGESCLMPSIRFAAFGD